MYPLLEMPGGWELVVIVLVIVVMFGAAKLPEFARGAGQALRIFKAETKGLRDGDDKADASSEQPIEGKIVDSPRDTTE